VIGVVLKVDGVSIKRDRPRGMPGDGGDECGVRREGGTRGWFRARAVTRLSWAALFAQVLEEGPFIDA
jgi:hypothetical protein